MQTLLSRFCEEFVRILQPMLPPLGRCAEVISKAAAADGASTKALQGPLADARHQLDLLCSKVAGQQAYVLIFGPLKSGKSTLMNAIAGSYVSEVSSLPAYPCMVFVSHAPRREFVLTRYNGISTTFGRPDELKTAVDVAHSELGARLREVEQQGQSFDPRLHFDQAISRIDVRVPTNELGPSRAVLVDTPGLYSRMKFGYDRMTRDFRNAAACAVFVVRSDNLFLEQVFAEFNDLLQLFSRIFLVVNIDARKQDLGPDGSLVPSLEQQDPARVIAAFESLAMSAPLAQALREGRLRIYPVDLLRAGRKRLSKTANGAAGADPGSVRSGGSDFDAFFSDLTEYVNSTDYLLSFLGDSMRHATSLVTEIERLGDRPEVGRLRARTAELEKESKQREARLQAIRVLAGFDWASALQQLADELTATCKDLAKEVEERTSRAAMDAVQAWFENDQSLQDLAKHELGRIFIRHQEELTAAASRELSERLVRDDLGIALPDNVRAALDTGGIDLGAISREAHGKTDRRALIAVPPTPLRPDHFAVRKTLWDSLLLRGQPSLRRRLFGPPDNPDLALSREHKATRLGNGARAEMRRRLDTYKRGFFDETVERLLAGFARGYCRTVLEDLTGVLREGSAEVEAEVAELARDRNALQQLLVPVDDLRSAAKAAAAALEKLGKHYGQVDLFLLTQPAELDYRLPAVAPKSAANGNESGAKTPAPPATSPSSGPSKPATKSDS